MENEMIVKITATADHWVKLNGRTQEEVLKDLNNKYVDLYLHTENKTAEGFIDKEDLGGTIVSIEIVEPLKEKFWGCECDSYFIHSTEAQVCSICGALQQNCSILKDEEIDDANHAGNGWNDRADGNTHTQFTLGFHNLDDKVRQEAMIILDQLHKKLIARYDSCGDMTVDSFNI